MATIYFEYAIYRVIDTLTDRKIDGYTLHIINIIKSGQEVDRTVLDIRFKL